MSDSSTTSLQIAQAALNQCQELLSSKMPPWTEVYASLSQAQRAIAIAEYCSDEEALSKRAICETPVDVPKPEISPNVDPSLPLNNPVSEAKPFPAAGASLADRLSEQRLEGLKNTLSINNRVRFASLLTDGNVPALLALCDSLEKSDSFEAAQTLILGVAENVDWDDEENGGVEFLGLVRRLFPKT